MNKRFISYLTLVAFAITSVQGKADISEEVQQELVESNSDPIVTSIESLASSVEDETLDDDYAEPEGTDVREQNNQSKNKARKQMWINIALAVTAVVVAVVALCIVSNNNGHHHHHKSE